MPSPLNDLPRKNLIALIERSGRSLCQDPVRCEGILRDLSPGHPREIFVLVAALRQQVGTDLLALPPGVSLEHHLHALSRRIYENLGICHPFAWWAVISWALALGVITREGDVKPPREIQETKPA